MYSRVKRPDREIMLYILRVLSVFPSVSPGSGNCINYGAIEDDKKKQTQKKVREGQIGFLMDCKIIFCHLRFSFLEVKWLLKRRSSRQLLERKTSKINIYARIYLIYCFYFRNEK